MDFKNLKEVAFSPPRTGLHRIKKILRTPESRFHSLPGFPYTVQYLQTSVHGKVRIAYVDEGRRDAEDTLLLMHGEPSWSYLYRHMIPPLVKAGFRVIAPDLPGFGRSDKPAAREDYSYERLVDWMTEYVVSLGLDDVTLFAQDWGGLVGLRVAARLPEHFARIAIANTGMPMGGGGAGKFFKVWASVISQQVPDWRPLLQGGTTRELSDAELVEENKGAMRRVYRNWYKPFLTLFSDSDAVSRGGEKIWKALVPGAKGQPHAIIKNAGHFLQEDAAPELCERLVAFVVGNPLVGIAGTAAATAASKL